MHPLIAVPGTLFLVIRSYRRNSLTPLGILTATVTAAIHAAYPSAIPFTLLVVFFMLGTTATKVKHEIKATLTLSSTGSSGGEGARTSTQVLANSGVASSLILFHLWSYGFEGFTGGTCFGGSDLKKDLILLGIVSNYAATTADTLSSELGILSKSKPRLITAPWKVVPPGTNGGVTFAGLLSGMVGSMIIGAVAVLLITFCDWPYQVLIQMIGYNKPRAWSQQDKATLLVLVTAVGTFGTLLDSLLGALLQASVVDKRTGKVVEGAGGTKVLTTSTRRASFQGTTKDKDEVSRKIQTGRDILDNNQINLLMAFLSTAVGILGASFLENSQGFLSRTA